MYIRAPLFAFVALWALGLCQSTPCLAIDNPDAPDYVGTFKARCLEYESKLGAATTTAAISAGYASYLAFLDQELNKAYSGLLQHVSGNTRDSLIASERKWVAYRDAEDTFIDGNWTNENFGTSSALSRGDYRASIVKQRVIQLLSYLKNY
jgi:uncharacterized protein YecT (DUF1311 family)